MPLKLIKRSRREAAPFSFPQGSKKVSFKWSWLHFLEGSYSSGRRLFGRFSAVDAGAVRLR